MIPSSRFPRRGRGFGFSFPEILVTIIFLVVGLSFLMGLYTSSTRGTTDVYLETIALSLANETLDWLSGFSFYDLKNKAVTDEIGSRLGMNEFRPVTDLPIGTNALITYPEDYYKFERLVNVEPREMAFLLTVKVRLGGSGLSLFRRELITLQKVVVAEYE